MEIRFMTFVMILSISMIFLVSVVRVGAFTFRTMNSVPFPGLKTKSIYSLSMSTVQPFNPFTARHKNSKIKWFEADLDGFFSFVEGQPLLTVEEEMKYGKALQMSAQVEEVRKELSAGLGLGEKLQNTDLAKALGCKETTLKRICRAADISKMKLVNSNLKLVLAVVSRYRSTTIANTELIAEGTRGLSKAVLRYDYTKGFRFATYATWYVHQAVADYVRWRKHPAKMPSRYLVLWRKIKLFRAEHKAQTNRYPSTAQIAKALGASSFDVIKVLNMQTYPLLLDAACTSCEEYKGEGKKKTIEDLLPSKFKAPLDHTNNADLRRAMENMLQSNLNDAERDVLRLRLGLDDGKEKPVKEVGKRFKISWKQVRTLEKDALSKISKSHEMKDFLRCYHTNMR